MVNRNFQTHTFEIRNPITGQSKVVHRNLLLCVNFLPVLPYVDDTASMISSCAADVDEAVDLSTEQNAQSDGVLDHTARTRHWVSQIPGGDESHPSEDQMLPVESCVVDGDHEGGVPVSVPVSDDRLSVQSILVLTLLSCHTATGHTGAVLCC